MDCNRRYHALIRYSKFVKLFKKMEIKSGIASAYYMIYFDLYNILIDFDIPTISLKLIKMCLNEIYSKVWIGIHLSRRFRRRCFISNAFQLRFRILNWESPTQPREDENEWDISDSVPY